MVRIRIRAGDVTLEADLNDSPSARLILDALPITGEASAWGDEIYFAIPVQAELEPAARQDMAVGELGYWPPGQAVCLFFGRTPVSTDDRPRAYSPVNPIGRIRGDATRLRQVADGAPCTLEALAP